MIGISLNDVRAYRIKHECGMETARREVLREKLREATLSATSVDDLRKVLLALIETMPKA